MEQEMEILLSQIKSTDVDIARTAIFKVGEKKITAMKPLLIELLDSQNQYIRDAAAMSLGDLKANEVVPKLIKLIQLPENENNRGSLIYALQSFEVQDYFLLFTELIINGNFEVKEMAIELIEKSVEKTEPNIRMFALKKLIDARNQFPEKQVASHHSVLKYIEYEIELILSINKI